ncbi:MAG TPA: protein-disulfide reductase DsbD domain-containing protein [Bacteroidota bacterium]|nr:protein-disulfide reductase DsbD domain-containing protein [Bacteroidota bacterium]
MNKCLGIFFAAATLCSPLAAQRTSAVNVQVSSKTLDQVARPGGTVRAEVKLVIANGWHINSHAPSQEYMIATSLVVDSTAAFPASGIRYPEARSVRLSLAESPLTLYEGTVVIQVTCTVAPDAPKGKHVLNGTVTFQACNDKVCLAPSAVPLKIPVTVGS